jgi:hypothetical protein
VSIIALIGYLQPSEGQDTAAAGNPNTQTPTPNTQHPNTNMKATLYIIRGLPGSGKSTLARKLCPNNSYEADEFFMHGGEYKFDAAKIKEAHLWCQAQVAASLSFSKKDTAVANTFTQIWEMDVYFQMAHEAGYDVQVISLTAPWQNTHNVPDETLHKMAKRWEHYGPCSKPSK